MKLLPVKEGVAIKIDSINKLEAIDEVLTRVFTGMDVYDVALPYSFIVDLIESSDNSGKDVENIRLLKEISQKVGFLPVYAG